MKTLAVDMDGVLADVYSLFVKMHSEEFGYDVTLEDSHGLAESAAFPGIYKYVNSKGFFRNVPLIEGCQECIVKLNEKYKLFIVSAATEFPSSLQDKQSWLNDHFPFITWRQMVFCGSKEIIKADIMIDDHFKNLDHFKGHTILFTQQHNISTHPGRHIRVQSWNEIGKLLL